jgi:hypothetical protein
MKSDHEKRFHSCCKSIIHAADVDHTKAVNWAYGYAQAGLSLYTSEGIRVQCLYILNNITHWRGDEAKRVRNELKSLAEELK